MQNSEMKRTSFHPESRTQRGMLQPAFWLAGFSMLFVILDHAQAAHRSDSLTPATSMYSASPTSSADHIRNLRQFGQPPSPWPRIVMAAGVLVLSGVLALRWIRRRHELSPSGMALRQLDAVRRRRDGGQVRNY